MADKNYYPQRQDDGSQAVAEEHVKIINISSLAAGATYGTWIYPGNARSIFWISKADTPAGTEKIYMLMRGAAGGATTSQEAIFKDDAPNTPATDAHASTVTSMIIGQCPRDMIPHEFTLHNGGSSAAAITLYINY